MSSKWANSWMMKKKRCIPSSMKWTSEPSQTVLRPSVPWSLHEPFFGSSLIQRCCWWWRQWTFTNYSSVLWLMMRHWCWWRPFTNCSSDLHWLMMMMMMTRSSDVEMMKWQWRLAPTGSWWWWKPTLTGNWWCRKDDEEMDWHNFDKLKDAIDLDGLNGLQNDLN